MKTYIYMYEVTLVTITLPYHNLKPWPLGPILAGGMQPCAAIRGLVDGSECHLRVIGISVIAH